MGWFSNDDQNDSNEVPDIKKSLNFLFIFIP